MTGQGLSSAGPAAEYAHTRTASPKKQKKMKKTIQCRYALVVLRHLLCSIPETMRRTQHGALLIVLMGAFSDFSNGQATPDRVPGQGHGLDVSPHQLTVLLEMANKGNSRAQWSLGNAYRDGIGVPQDYREAVRWYSSAAAQNLAAAQLALGYLYEYGKGVRRNYREAFRLYEAAALQGNTAAASNLGSMYQSGRATSKNMAQALHWYIVSAQGGNHLAQCNLAWIYLRGIGVHRDREQALWWLRTAAVQGFAPAQNFLASMYYKGDGIGRDYAEAARWARRAADQGYPPAQENLAFMFEQGTGVSLDYVAAYAWYSAAAAAGRRQSRDRVQNLVKIMTPEQLRAAKALERAQQVEQHKARDLERSPDSGSLSFLPDW